MRKPLSPSERGFNARDRQRLSRALTETVEARIFRRIQSVLLIAEGRTPVEAAQITRLSLQSVYNQLDRYLQTHRVESLFDLPHPGRPPDAPDLTEAQILRELRRSRSNSVTARMSGRWRLWPIISISVTTTRLLLGRSGVG